MGRLSVKIVPPGGSQPVGRDIAKSDLYISDRDSPIPMKTADFEAAVGGTIAESKLLQLEDGGLIEHEDSTGFLELEG